MSENGQRFTKILAQLLRALGFIIFPLFQFCSFGLLFAGEKKNALWISYIAFFGLLLIWSGDFLNKNASRILWRFSGATKAILIMGILLGLYFERGSVKRIGAEFDRQWRIYRSEAGQKRNTSWNGRERGEPVQLQYGEKVDRTPEVQPSFDCSLARPGADTLICITPELARADVEMADTYHRLHDQLSPKLANLLSQNQARWRKHRDAACKEVQPCRDMYFDRQSELKELEGNPENDEWILASSDEIDKTICGQRNPCAIINYKRAANAVRDMDIWIIQADTKYFSEPEFWLVWSRAGKIIRKQYVGILETDMSGDVDIDGNILYMHEHIGAMHGWGHSLKVRLDTFEPLEQTYGTKGSEWTWDWHKFSGRGQIHFPEAQFVLVPQITQDPNFWNKVPLGNCAASLSAHGISMKVLLLDKQNVILNVYGVPEESAPDQIPVIELKRSDFRDNISILFRVTDGVIEQTFASAKLAVDMSALRDPNGKKVRSFKVTYPLETTLSKEPYILIRYGIDHHKDEPEWLVSNTDSSDPNGYVISIPRKYAACAPKNGVFDAQIAPHINENDPLFDR